MKEHRDIILIGWLKFVRWMRGLEILMTSNYAKGKEIESLLLFWILMMTFIN